MIGHSLGRMETCFALSTFGAEALLTTFASAGIVDHVAKRFTNMITHMLWRVETYANVLNGEAPQKTRPAREGVREGSLRVLHLKS